MPIEYVTDDEARYNARVRDVASRILAREKKARGDDTDRCRHDFDNLGGHDPRYDVSSHRQDDSVSCIHNGDVHRCYSGPWRY